MGRRSTSMRKRARISARHLYKYQAFRALTDPFTQEDWYRSQNASEEILSLVRQKPNVYSNVCADIAREAHPLTKPPNETRCNHVDADGNKYRQVSARHTSTGKRGSWEHIQPSRPWDYLLLVHLDVKGLTFYRMSRSNFNELRTIGIVKKVNARQQESVNTNGRYALSLASFNGRYERFSDFAEAMSDVF